MTYLDTHVVAWLYSSQVTLLSARAKKHIEDNELVVSPMVLLELDFLREVGRIAEGGRAVYQELHTSIGLRICEVEFSRVIAAASTLDWTRDPFDRIIVGQAAVSDSDLVTRDDAIRQHYPRTIW